MERILEIIAWTQHNNEKQVKEPLSGAVNNSIRTSKLLLAIIIHHVHSLHIIIFATTLL